MRRQASRERGRSTCRPGDLRDDGGRLAAAGQLAACPTGRAVRPARSTRSRSTSSRARSTGSTGTPSSGAATSATPFASSSGSRRNGLFVGGVTLPLALAELGMIDAYECVVHPRLVRHGRRSSRASRSGRPDARGPVESARAAVAMRYRPAR